MKTKDIERVIVTGGVGFIDSHLIDNIITQDTHVTVFDNITNGTLQNIKQRIDKPNLTFIKGDLPNPSTSKNYKKNTTTLSSIWRQTQKSEWAQPVQTSITSKTFQQPITCWKLLEKLETNS